MPFSTAKYGHHHRTARAALLARNEREHAGLCNHCWAADATVADHQPPLSAYLDPRDWEGTLVASCKACSDRQGRILSGRAARRRRRPEWTRSRDWSQVAG